MPEIKNTFTSGKMNKDLDERLVPNGQYRDAMNVEVASSDSDTVGALTNSKGNVAMNSTGIVGATCVGSIVDTENDRIIWFICGNTSNAIVEYSLLSSDISPILVDTTKTLLGFRKKVYITGINILNGTLFWTDNVGQPKKIDIEQMKSGLVPIINGVTTGSNTVIFFDSPSVWGSNLGDTFSVPPTTTVGLTSSDLKVVVNGVEDTSFTLGSNSITLTGPVASGDDISVELISTRAIFTQRTFYIVNGYNRQYPKKKNIFVARRFPLTAPDMQLSSSARDGNVTNASAYTPSTFVGGNEHWWLYIDDNNITRKKPPGVNSKGPFYQNQDTNPPSNMLVDINGDPVILLRIQFPNNSGFKEDDIVVLTAPNNSNVLADQFTDPLKIRLLLGEENNVTPQNFEITILSISDSLLDQESFNKNGGGAINWSVSLEQAEGIYQNVFPRFAYRWKYADGAYSAMSPFTEVAFLPKASGYEYDSKEGNNIAMQNDVRKITLSNFQGKLVDVDEVDILVKNSNSNNVYVADTIQTNATDIGTVEITQENISSLLPSNQLLRHFDNVPLKARAQEVSANRIIYGNYYQQRNLPQFFEKRVSFNFSVRSNDITSKFAKSVKSLRTYQVGVSFLDDLGRQTPVFSSDNSTVKLGQISSSTQNYLTTNLKSFKPSWAKHLKYYIKENSNEYYNIALDRYYNDEIDGNVWLSFSSNETNKVEVDDYIILKKAHGSNNPVYDGGGDTVKYKVLAKESMAPESIKYKKESLGKVNGIKFSKQVPGNLTDGYPEKGFNTLKIQKSAFSDTELEDVNTWTTASNEKFLKISLATSGNVESNFYEVSNVVLKTETVSSVDYEYYEFTLKTPFGDDISFVRTYYVPPTTSTQNSDNANKRFSFEYFENVNRETASEFKGRFFIKVKSDNNLKNYVLNTQNSTIGANYVSMAQNMRYIRHGGNSPGAANTTIDNRDYDKDYTDWPSTLTDFDPPISSDTNKMQYWAVDDGYYYEEGSPSAKSHGPSGSEGGFQVGNQMVAFRFCGRIPSFLSKGIGWTYDNYKFYDVLDQSDFNPNTYSFFQKMAKGVGLKFRWYHDPGVIYEVIESTIIPIKNFNSADNTNASGLEAVNGVVFKFKLNKQVATGIVRDGITQANTVKMNVLSNNSTLNSSDNTKVFEIIETLPNDESFFTENPAVFEVEPKEDPVDLNLFYETSRSILIPKVNYYISCPQLGQFGGIFNNSTITSITEDTLTLTKFSNTTGLVPAGTIVKIHDGSKYESNEVDYNFAQDFVLAEDMPSGTNTVKLRQVQLDWSNCFAFGNGVESNRIKDDFNAPIMDKGPKVSSTFSRTYKQEHLKTGLIYSGIFVTKDGINNSNQFIQAEKITKQLNPEYGSIQKLFTRNTNMVTFCEDKTLKVLVDKNALFNADGNPQLLSTDSVLGQVIPFVGDFGISKNPESFANYGYRVYYTDRKKGAVLRLSGDGITNIAEKGMLDYFKTNMRDAETLLGSYDETKDIYNLTLKYPQAVGDTTVSFTERVNGWTSFKSFIPEAGCSLNNGYYTVYNGEIWKHGVNDLRNTYYNTFTASKVRFVFNTEFSSVKTFKTLNYEGSTSRIYSTVSGQEDQVATKGWYNNTITTDLDSGTIPYFLDKENKWFNYIQGNSTGTTTNDISEKSFQGLGFASAVGSTSAYHELVLNGTLTDNSLDYQPLYDWVGGTGLPNGTKTTITNQTGAISDQVFTIEPKVVNGVKYVIAEADFSLQGTPTGISGIVFADTATPYAINNNVTATISFSTNMPSSDDTRSFTVIGNANPQAL
jgi:hypothetical protein